MSFDLRARPRGVVGTLISAWLGVAVGGCDREVVAPPAVPLERDTVVARVEVIPPERVVGILGTRFDVRAFALNAAGETLYGTPQDPGRFTWSSTVPDVAEVGFGLSAILQRETEQAMGVTAGVSTITATSQGVSGSSVVTVGDHARLVWSVALGRGSTQNGVAIGHDGTIYIGVDDLAADGSRWFALSPQGGILWILDLPRTPRQTPAIRDDGTLYLSSMSSSGLIGRLIAVDPAGTVRWMLEDFEEAIRSSPALGADGTVYVGAGHHVYAVDPDGEIRWTYRSPTGRAFVFSSPAVASDGTIYVGGEDQFLHAINPDGSGRWTFRARDRIRSSPSIGPDGTIYFGSYDGWLYAVHPDGTERWSVGLHCGLPWGCQRISRAPSIGPDGTVYVHASDRLFAVDPGGAIRSQVQVVWGAGTAALGANGTVYTSRSAYDALGTFVWDSTPEDRWRTYSDGPAAIGLDGTVFMTSYGGITQSAWEVTVLAIRENGASDGGFDGAPWPQHRADRANTGRVAGP